MIGRVCMRFSKPRAIVQRNILKESNAAFSAEAAALFEEKLPRFRTYENNPVNHNELHIGKFYTISPEIRQTLYHSGGISKSLNIQMETFCETAIMIRKPALEIINYLKNLNYSYPATRFVLYGDIGVGKSVTLMHILHYAHTEKFLLLHIPWVSNWTKTPKEVVPSLSRSGRVDIPRESTKWLHHFKSQNLKLLQELDLKTTKTYTWSQRETTEEGKPLLDVVEHGLKRGRHSSDCIGVLLKEIKQYSKSGKFKTLVAIDGVNGFYAGTNQHYFSRSDKTLIPPADISVVHAFMKIINNDWNNAAVVTTVDSIIINKNEKVLAPFMPRALLGKEGFELLDPFIPVLVENYADKEIESALDYYIDRKWIQLEEARSSKGRAELKFLSGKNPYTLRKYCDPL